MSSDLLAVTVELRPTDDGYELWAGDRRIATYPAALNIAVIHQRIEDDLQYCNVLDELAAELACAYNLHENRK